MTTVRKLWITYSGTGGPSTYAGYFVDNVILQGGITEPDAPQNVILTNEVEGSGTTGAPINVVITEKFISNRTEQTDPLPSDAQTTFRLADGTLRKVAASLLFSAGADGNDGWSPVFGIASDGARRVLQLTDWVGGEGAKPATGQYVGVSGLVVSIGDGVDIRGEAGVNGTNGTNGADGADGADGREVELQVSGTVLEWRYVGDPSWTTLIDLATLPASSEFALGGLFRFDTATTDADPGAGKLRFNNATVASVTFIYIDTTTDTSIDISNFTKSLKTGDVVYIQDKDNSANWVRFRLTANAVDGTGYYKLAVVYVDGSGTVPANNARLLVLYFLDTQTAQTYPAATHRENNTILFDNDYVTGINAAARSGNILFDFTGAQLGASTVMRHQDASAFTFPTEADLMFDTADISTTVANYFMFSIVKTTSAQVVHVFHAIEGGV